MTPGTALDIIGIYPKKVGATLLSHTCPWCGDMALSGRWHMQCWNQNCPAFVAAPEDIILFHVGNDVGRAADLIYSVTGRASMATLLLRAQRRKVMDFWLKLCREQPTRDEVAMLTRLERDNMTAAISPLSIVPLGRPRMVRLIQLAAETGADYSPSWTEETPPLPALAYVIQTAPHSVDRIMLRYINRDSPITWRDRSVGISGLLGMRADVRRPMVCGKDAALALQMRHKNGGSTVPVASIHVFPKAEHKSELEWAEEDPTLVAVADNPRDVVLMQQALSRFPSMERAMLAADCSEKYQTTTSVWPDVRRGMLLHAATGGVDRLPTRCVELFEQCGSNRSDAAHAIKYFESVGSLRLAEDMRRLASCRVIFQEGKLLVREDASEYVAVSSFGATQVANFTLALHSNVAYQERGEVCHSGLLRIGTDEKMVTVSGEALKQPKKLQEELGTQYTRAVSARGTLSPTVVDHGMMSRYVLMDMRRTAAKLPTVRGLDHLGWSDDRETYDMPGLTVTASGVVDNSAIFHPGVQSLRVFSKPGEWSNILTGGAPACCTDVVAGILAQMVRHYLRCPIRPFLVSNDSHTMSVVAHLLEYVGQTSVFEMNINMRENHHNDGVRGYPIMAHGNQNARNVQLGFLLLTPDGLRIERPARELVDAAGRFLQCAMTKVAAWCLRSRADAYREASSVSHNAALVSEGTELLKLVCGVQVQPGVISSTPALDKLLSNFTVEQLASRLVLFDNMRLKADTSGVEWDRDRVTEELLSLDSSSEVSGDTLLCAAPVVMPALARYYGVEPSAKVAMTEAD